MCSPSSLPTWHPKSNPHRRRLSRPPHPRHPSNLHRQNNETQPPNLPTLFLPKHPERHPINDLPHLNPTNNIHLTLQHPHPTSTSRPNHLNPPPALLRLHILLQQPKTKNNILRTHTSLLHLLRSQRINSLPLKTLPPIPPTRLAPGLPSNPLRRREQIHQRSNRRPCVRRSHSASYNCRLGHDFHSSTPRSTNTNV